MNTKSIGIKMLMVALSGSMLMAGSCSSVKNAWNGMSQTGQGATAGGAIGAAVGTGVGALIGGGKGTWIGALVGGALGAGTGALVGNSMDRQKKELEKELASVKELASQRDTTYIVQTVKDSNDLDAIRLVLGDAVLFNTGSASLSAGAQAALSRVAYNLKQYPKTDVTILGFTDNTGSVQRNNQLSQQRADAVMNYLESQGIPASRLKAIGKGESDPIDSNETAAGRAQNRRVEMYITASQQMINDAQASN